jgi:hypothetical protein
MTLPSARLLLFVVALPCVLGSSARAAQQPIDTLPTKTAGPIIDPVTVRGCLEGHWLRILEHDASDLSGVQRVRLKGARSMLRLLDDQRGDYVEVTGDLDLGPRDRIETRRKVKVGKTTISLGASGEQLSGERIAAVPDPTLVVDAFTKLGERCPRH